MATLFAHTYRQNQTSKGRRRLVFGALLACTFLVHAEQTRESPGQAGGTARKKSRQELYGGVVANETVTVAGQDFYQYFVAAWRDRDMSERFAISIHERPSARWGSQIWIEYAQRRIFQSQLPNGRAGIKALTEQAVEVAYQQLADAEVERLLFRDPDIGSDEI
jgi:curli production assembly/transport component CsgE